MDTIERLVIEAAQQEAEKPSFENLPDTGMVMRTRTDANVGTKFNEFYGKRSLVGPTWGDWAAKSSGSLTGAQATPFGVVLSPAAR